MPLISHSGTSLYWEQGFSLSTTLKENPPLWSLQGQIDVDLLANLAMLLKALALLLYRERCFLQVKMDRPWILIRFQLWTCFPFLALSRGKFRVAQLVQLLWASHCRGSHNNGVEWSGGGLHRAPLKFVSPKSASPSLCYCDHLSGQTVWSRSYT